MLAEEFSLLSFDELKEEWKVLREHLSSDMKELSYHQALEEVAKKLKHLPNLWRLAVTGLTLPVSTAGK